MPDETGSAGSGWLRSLPMLISILIADYVLFRLIPGVDTGGGRTLRYAPLLALSAVLFLLGLALRWRSMQAKIDANPASVQRPAASEFTSRMYAGLLVAGVAGTIFLAYLVGKLLVFRLDHETVWKDTLTYAAQAEAPLWASQFWAGERSFTLPLFYKLLDIDRAALNQTSRLRQLSGFQLIFGVLSWTILAAVTGRLIKTRWLNLLGFGVILALGLTLDVSLWDRIPLSESVSTSLLILLLSLALLGLKYRHRLGRGGAWWQIPFWIVFVVLCVLYSFTRDTNAFFLFGCGLVILLAVLVQRIRGHGIASAWIVLSILLISLFAVQSATANRGNRWVLPYLNVLHIRIFPDESAREFYQAAGMPADDLTVRILTRNRPRFLQELAFNFAAKPLVDWVETRGRATYLRYLFSRPVDTFMQPIRQARKLISPLSTEYRTDKLSVPVWLNLLSRVFFPLPLGILLAWMGAVAILTYRSATVSGVRPEWLVPGLMLITALPMMYVVWYGDAIEVERHAFQISLQVRLALWIMSVFLADAWLVKTTSSSSLAA
jgi:hypothetical protein